MGHLVMTRAAEEFVRPLTFAALTGRKVLTHLFSAASAEDTLSSKPENNEKNLDKGVAKMFKAFPPGPAKG